MVIHVEIYLAASQLEREGKSEFSKQELMQKIEKMFDDTRSGVATHIDAVCNASAPKNHAKVYNYLTKLDSDQYRLWRKGDKVHPSREGAPHKPEVDQVPYRYWPLWAEDETMKGLFQGFREENFALFETNQQRFQAGDQIAEQFKQRWQEWEQFGQLVTAETGFIFDFSSESWQNSGNLSNKRFWSRLREKGKENLATNITMAIFRDKLIISLGFFFSLDRKGKAVDNREQFNSWLDDFDEQTIPEKDWKDYWIAAGDQEISLRQYFSDPSIKNRFKRFVQENEDAYLDLGKTYSRDEVLELGEEIVREAAAVVQTLYPLYKNVVRKSLDSMFLIGASTTLHERFDQYQDFLEQHGTVMYWWSYIIREEYQNYLQQHLPFTLYVYGVTAEGKRAITHSMTVNEFASARGSEGLLSPYPEYTLIEHQDKRRLGEEQSTIFKTWLKVTKLEELSPPLGLDEFVHYDTRGYINPSIMRGSFVYARKIPRDALAQRLANCLHTVMEEFALNAASSQPLVEMIRESKGFSFELDLREESIKNTGVKRLSGSRYKNSNRLLLHVLLAEPHSSLQVQLQKLGYDLGRLEEQGTFLDGYTGTTDEGTVSVKLSDINLDNFGVHSFSDPLDQFLTTLRELGMNVKIKDEEESVKQHWEMHGLKEILYAIRESEFVYSKELVVNLHNCLHALPEKHFIILSGISGTGKTRITQTYVNALYGLPPGDRNNPFFLLVPVQPQWSDRTGLLGYYNPITGTYQQPLFLAHLLAALNDPDHLYFVCLDEMNLAVVEHYFADVLSAMESNQDIELHSYATPIDGVPRFVQIPDNFYIVGTVNIDETTHSFSPKVLDRAYTIEFNEVQLDLYLDKFMQRADAAPYQDLLQLLSRFCKDIYAILEPQGLHFAYRTCKEILAYMIINEQHSVALEYTTALDLVIMQKILPKLRGDERIEATLKALFDRIALEMGDTDNSKSLQRLQQMLDELQEYGSCQFWR